MMPPGLTRLLRTRGPAPPERALALDPVHGVRRRARRLGLQVAGILLALIASLGAVAGALYEHNEHVTAERRLRAAVSAGASAGRTPGMWVVVRPPAGGDREPRRIPRGLPLEQEMHLVEGDGRARQVEATVGSRIYFVRTVRRPDGSVVQAAFDRTAAEEASGRMVLALLVAGGVGVPLVAVVAALLARRTLDPVTEALRMQQRFVSDASHELRTPLTLLSTRVQLLARRLRAGEGLPAEVERDLSGVLEDTASLTGILDDLLLAATPGEEGSEPCEVVELVRPVIGAASASASSRGLDLRLGTAERATVAGSAVALRRAVTSLVDNALDHARSRVEVEVRAGARHVEVVVRDDGPGVPAEQARRMFERFSSSRSGPGVDGRRHYGLGLALVSDIAAAHHGSVSVRAPAAGSGATLVLTLPRVVRTSGGG